jgi:hypothetical protein
MAVRTAAEVHQPGGDQHPHSRRNHDHVATFTTRNTVVSDTASIPGGTRTVAAPSAISIMCEPPGCAVEPAPESGDDWVRLAEARLAVFVGTTCFLKVNPVSATMTAKHVYQVRAGQQ